MSLKSHEARKLAVAGLAALASLGVATSSADAATKTKLDFTCKYPLIGTQPLSLDITLGIPTSWPVFTKTDKFPITAVATAGGDTVEGLKSINGLAAISGVSTALAKVVLPTGAVQDAQAIVNIDKYTLPNPIPDPLVLNAAGATPSLTFDDPGTATIKLSKLQLVLRAYKADGSPLPLVELTRGVNNEPVTPSDTDPNTFDVYCKFTDPTVVDPTLGSFQITEEGGTTPPVDNAPSAPGAPTLTSATNNSVTIGWTAATDDKGISKYEVYEGTTKVAETTGATTATISGLAQNSTHTYTVKAIDTKPQPGPASAAGTVKTTNVSGPDTTAPSKPVVTVTPGVTSVVVNHASTDNVGVAGYDVTVGTKTVSSAGTATSTTVTGLTASTAYAVKVVARDAAGNKAETTTNTTTLADGGTGGGAAVNYTLKGSATLNTLTKGNLALSGGIQALLDTSTGKFTADLQLADTNGKLTALGFLPVSAKIGFVPAGKTTGTLLDGVLLTKSLIRIKVKEVKLFGAIPLAGGNNCQTKSLSEINLKSTQPDFAPFKGGNIAGKFSISDLNGCGGLNGLVSPLTAGSGNTISLDLTPIKQ